MIVVTIDYGYSLGDHGWLVKNVGPVYRVIAHTPLLIHHPDAEGACEQIDALTTAVDIYPTLLEGLEIDAPEHTRGRSLFPLLTGDTVEHRDLALYGYFWTGVNVTEGRYTCPHANPGVTTDCYSTYQMPSGRSAKAQPEAEAAILPYTKAPVWWYPTDSWTQNEQDQLFDVKSDPNQERNIADEASEERDRLRELIVKGMERL